MNPTGNQESSPPPPPYLAPQEPGAPDSPAPPGDSFSPPPPSNLGFPFCKCERTNYNTPFRFSMGEAIDTGSHTWVSGTLESVGCEVSSDYPCCDMNLKKIEFQIKDTCRSAVGNITVDGKSHAPTFQSYGEGRLVFKITKLNLDYWTAPGVVVAFSLNKAVPGCSTTEDFMVHDTVAIFDSTQRCCPLVDVYGGVPELRR